MGQCGDEMVWAALVALENATSWTEYETGKRLVGKLGRLQQMAMVDAIKAARRRIERSAT